MPKQKDVRKNIVALKRQSAEQRVRALQTDADRIEASLAAQIASLHGLDTASSGFDALRLAEEHGHPPRLIAAIRSAEAALSAKRAELHTAREALKHVFHSEERLGEAGGRG